MSTLNDPYSYSGYQPSAQYSSTAYNTGSISSNNGSTSTSPAQTLRRRHIETSSATGSMPPNGLKSPPRSANMVKKLDFMFPKVDTEYTVQTDRGGAASLVAYILIGILVFAEFLSWSSQNNSTIEHVSVDASLGKKMRVNLNITFPALACVDLHVDVMDVAGDSQLNIEDTMVKQRLNMMGRTLGKEEKVESNANRLKQEQNDKIKAEKMPVDYCGPCYGAHEHEDECCNTCDDLMKAYEKKRWRTDLVVMTSEQCIREGRDKVEPKRMTRGEGCNLSGYMTLNRVAGNFHIAMGEGIERDGRHIHTFNPDDTPNFNSSHIIHELSFGPPGSDENDGSMTMNGIRKIVTKEYGSTGLFQYFIKIVPTTYMQKGKSSQGRVETNRYFFTERFRPLMSEYLDDDKFDEEEPEKAAVEAGHAGSHANHKHHHVQNSVLPGVFFMYEIYPFAVEVYKNEVPFTHLLIRIMATVGGVFTIIKWVDGLLERRK